MAFAKLGDSARAWELLSMINPANHALSAAGVETYKLEPYVVAADVYALKPHVGRGGWSWYTGSAGWMYRLVVESLLGLRRQGSTLHLAPCLPADWPACRISYRYGETLYLIAIEQTPGASRMTLDGVELPDKVIPLLDDRLEHRVELAVQS
jgi:cellobiose phosphorylase